jgi:hypothetical protein
VRDTLETTSTGERVRAIIEMGKIEGVSFGLSDFIAANNAETGLIAELTVDQENLLVRMQIAGLPPGRSPVALRFTYPRAS